MDSLNLGQKLDDVAQPESVTILIFSQRENVYSTAWLRLFWRSWPGHWGSELWGRAASTSIYIFILLMLPSGLCLFPSAKGSPPSHLPRHLKKPSSWCGSLSFLGIPRVPHYKLQAQEVLLSCGSSSVSSLRHTKSPIGRPIRFIPTLNLQPVYSSGFDLAAGCMWPFWDVSAAVLGTICFALTGCEISPLWPDGFP